MTIRHVFAWLFLLFLLFSTLGLPACSGTAKCTGGISSTDIDPNKSPCKEDCECNNQHFEGVCLAEACSSIPRDPCTTIGATEECTPKTVKKGETCKKGLRVCKDFGLEVMKWGDCKCRSVELPGSTETSTPQEQVTPVQDAGPEPSSPDQPAGPDKVAVPDQTPTPDKTSVPDKTTTPDKTTKPDRQPPPKCSEGTTDCKDAHTQLICNANKTWTEKACSSRAKCEKGACKYLYAPTSLSS